VTPTARAIRCWRYLAGVSLPGRANRPRTFPLNSALRLSVQAFRIGSTRVRAKVVRPLAALRWRRIRAVRLVDVSDEACPLRIKRVQLGQQPRIPLSQRPFAQSGICNKREYPERAEAGASFETPARTFRCPVCVTAVREAAAFKLYRKSLKSVASPRFRGAAPDPARWTLRGTCSRHPPASNTRDYSRCSRKNGQI
jgi:hypothetical protein